MSEQELKRQVVLDTETTGMNQDGGPVYLNHKIIEIGCVELINRRPTGRHYHVYINPGRPVDEEAYQVHGISDEFLADKPTFSEVCDEFLDFIKGAELVIHNAPFDVGFMDYEFDLLGKGLPKTADICGILDSLELAKKLHPGQRNNLDVLCKRYGIDNSNRVLHGALLDAEILADVYLAMSGGQTSLKLVIAGEGEQGDVALGKITRQRSPLMVIRASEQELGEHESRLDLVNDKGGSCLWRQ